jgi:phage shock protein B
MGHHLTAIIIVAIIAWAVVAIIRGPLGRRSGLRQAGGWGGLRWNEEESRQLSEMTALADRLQTRVETLEKLLDGVQPDWRTKV